MQVNLSMGDAQLIIYKRCRERPRHVTSFLAVPMVGGSLSCFNARRAPAAALSHILHLITGLPQCTVKNVAVAAQLHVRGNTCMATPDPHIKASPHCLYTKAILMTLISHPFSVSSFAAARWPRGFGRLYREAPAPGGRPLLFCRAVLGPLPMCVVFPSTPAAAAAGLLPAAGSSAACSSSLCRFR